MRTILILLIASLAYSQSAVKTVPNKHQTVNILNTTSFEATATTSAISTADWNGAAVAYCYFDTATGETTLNAITIAPQVYNSLTATWHDYFDGGTMVTIANTVWDEDYVYVTLGTYDDWAPSDSVRFVVVADTGTVRIDIGGQ